MASSRRKSPEAYLPEKKQSQRNPRTRRNLHFRSIRPGCTRLFERGGEKRGRPCPSRSRLNRSHCSSRLPTSVARITCELRGRAGPATRLGKGGPPVPWCLLSFTQN